MAKSLPGWNLSGLYSGIEDKQIDSVMKRTEKSLQHFVRACRGSMKKISSSGDRLRRAFEAYEAILTDVAKPVIYAQLLFAESCSDPRRGAFLQRMKAWHTKMEKSLLFFELELLELPERKLKALSKSPALKACSNFLHQLALTRPHRLSENEEQILSDKALTGREAFTRLFDQELSQKQFIVTERGGKKRLPESEVLSMLYSPVRSRRKTGAMALTNGLKEEAPRLAFIFNTLVEDKAVEDRIRKFTFPEQSRHLGNQIDRKMVDAMASVVASHYGLVQDFYRFKKKLLRVGTLYDYDRYAPVVRSERSLSFSEARRLVLEAFTKFSPEYGRIGRKFFTSSWIDAAKRPGKRGGAFCSFVTPDRNPYVFMNFNGNVRDVFTLAHELGHGIHAYLMRSQNYLNYDVPLTVAETASVFAEMLLFDHLAETLTSRKELLALYVNKVESIFATVFRQISLYRFEQGLHKAHEEKGELMVPEINAIWRRTQVEMFGNSITLSEGYDWWWSYIPHFIHSPFYVYAYAYGELLTLSLYAKHKKGEPGFAERYLELLSLGSSKNPTGLLEPFGVQMEKKAFWENGVKLIAEMVEKTRSLV